MDMPVKAQVECLDGMYGQEICLIINPATRFVTHVVVEDEHEPEIQYLVPLDELKLSTPHLIQLRCTTYELRQMPRFVHITYEHRTLPAIYPPEIYLSGVAAIMEEVAVPITHEQVPEGELAVHQGAQVEAKDGHLGQLDEFLLDPTTKQIDYLVFREHHLWHHEELIVSASQIEQIKDDKIYLKSDKQTIEQMQSAAAHAHGE
ncbi:MAG TPA: hypothetical protein VLG46_18095 [Anaerolineae bacterium]|nr:hypothetical protein [Anaerolineae bacterium]